jgi:polyribonucleotide nucleotidyltransferase
MVLETGRHSQAGRWAVLVRYGDNGGFSNCHYGQEQKERIDFFPLTSIMRKGFMPLGKYPAVIIRREGRPSEKAVLIRQTD